MSAAPEVFLIYVCHCHRDVFVALLHHRRVQLVHVRVKGQLVPRSLAQLSGGERRRVALALALGFADLVRSRGRLTCNLLVLDEVGPEGGRTIYRYLGCLPGRMVGATTVH